MALSKGELHQCISNGDCLLVLSIKHSVARMAALSVDFNAMKLETNKDLGGEEMFG